MRVLSVIRIGEQRERPAALLAREKGVHVLRLDLGERVGRPVGALFLALDELGGDAFDEIGVRHEGGGDVVFVLEGLRDAP